MDVFWLLIVMIAFVMLAIVGLIAYVNVPKKIHLSIGLILAFFVISFSIGMYIKLGASVLLSEYLTQQKHAAVIQKEVDALGDLDQIIVKMEKIVQERQDAQGWLLLSRLYAKTERFHESTLAFNQFKELSAQQIHQPSSPPLPQVQLIVKVVSADHLKDAIKSDEILFVYAQSAEGASVPLAIVKRHAKELPLVVILDDTLAMLPTDTLRDTDHVNIIARISTSGEPIAQKGDLQGKSGIIDLNDHSDVVVVVIDEVI